MDDLQHYTVLLNPPTEKHVIPEIVGKLYTSNKQVKSTYYHPLGVAFCISH